jgi:hypothetical protein
LVADESVNDRESIDETPTPTPDIHDGVPDSHTGYRDSPTTNLLLRRSRATMRDGAVPAERKIVRFSATDGTEH